jgi:hypothetical protein
MSTMSIETLHLRALQQRTQLHRTMSELREKVENTRDKIRLSKQAREHLISFSVVASLVGLAFGYAVGGLFVRE